MAKSIMGGHNMGSLKSGESGGRTTPKPAAPAPSKPQAAAPTTPAVMGPRPAGVGQQGAMPVPPPMQITPNTVIRSNGKC